MTETFIITVIIILVLGSLLIVNLNRNITNKIGEYL